jgi:hypothetical protein
MFTTASHTLTSGTNIKKIDTQRELFLSASLLEQQTLSKVLFQLPPTEQHSASHHKDRTGLKRPNVIPNHLKHYALQLKSSY